MAAEPVTAVAEAEARTMAASAPTEAPWVRPRMSGLPRGLRVRVWKSAPARPRQAPTAAPVTRRGRRMVQTM